MSVVRTRLDVVVVPSAPRCPTRASPSRSVREEAIQGQLTADLTMPKCRRVPQARGTPKSSAGSIHASPLHV
jgi:hypothetical protein